MTTAFSLAPLFRHSVGFDRFNDLFESAARNEAGSSYPPYNVEKHGDDQYRIVVAAAGFQEEDLDLQVEKGVLTVTGGKRDNGSAEVTYLHQGIAQDGGFDRAGRDGQTGRIGRHLVKQLVLNAAANQVEVRDRAAGNSG